VYKYAAVEDCSYMGFTINEDWGGVIVRLLFLAVLVMVGLSYMTRGVMESPRTSPESYAISSMRTVVTSQFTYSKTFGSETYADSLDLLYSSSLIDSVLATGTKDGFTFILLADAGNDSFAIYATPISYDAKPRHFFDNGTRRRSFLSDQTGVIRYTAEERPATVEDKPLGQ